MTNEELVQLYQNGDKYALDEILKNNRGIITKLTNKYDGINKELEWDDLFNSGVLGLMEAAEKYKFDKENKAQFITYAVSYINRCIHNCANGRSAKEKENNKFYKSCVSLNTPIGDDEDCAELLETVKSECMDYEYVEDRIYNGELRRDLEQVMNSVNTLKERQILKLLHGWDCKAMSEIEISEVFGVTRTAINNIKRGAFNKIRRHPEGKELKKEYLILKLGYIKNKSKQDSGISVDYWGLEEELRKTEKMLADYRNMKNYNCNDMIKGMYLKGYTAPEIALKVDKSIDAVSKMIQRKFKEFKADHDKAIELRKERKRIYAV
ncbi:sigma-70 family RNA polymerase sigma factor [Clostridium butyricum]|uniref:sigma-70 family RNA polymerase sigma factor n=1 Tax=Clostridium butyricum TaxID=1492 RepID=UPI003466741B